MIEEGYDIIGFPRLVRLNPNVPWKTRGNGAISVHVGKGVGKKKEVGRRRKKSLHSFSTVDQEDVKVTVLADIVDNIIRSCAVFSDAKTNPGFVICKEKPPGDVYVRGVKGILKLSEIKRLLENMGATYKGYKNERGLIGATAAVAWTPIDKTYELITYRFNEKWGTTRYVDVSSVQMLDNICSSTFDNYDYVNKHNRITPNSPCPVLYGIRGDNPDELLKAISVVKSEEYVGWLLFETNQGTDDHLQKKKIEEIKPGDSVIIEGKVASKPSTIVGGHVVFKLRDESNKVIDCAAYEPTKQFRDIIRELQVGDTIKVFGGVREKPFTINLEKIHIKKLVRIKKKVENPICTRCGKHMKSIGKEAGYRCIRCGLEVDEKQVRFVSVKRVLKPGFYEVPVCARRHLSKPLKRMKIHRMIK